MKKIRELRELEIEEKAKIEFNQLKPLPEIVNKMLDTDEYMKLYGSTSRYRNMERPDPVKYTSDFNHIFSRCKSFYKKYAHHFI
jgi:hypothetical protein